MLVNKASTALTLSVGGGQTIRRPSDVPGPTFDRCSYTNAAEQMIEA
jgi:hypothetical protein